MIKCGFCSYEFNESDSKACCRGCPMNRACSRSKCPNCGFEVIKEPALIKYLKKKWGKKNV